MSFLDDWRKHGGKRPSDLGRFSVEADKWDVKRFEQMLREMRVFDAERSALCEVAETGNGLWADAFFAFNKVDPRLVDPGKLQAKYGINRTVMGEAMELSEYERLKQWTAGDQVAAAGACIAMRPDLEQLYDRTKTAQKMADELQQKMEDLVAAQQEQRDLDELVRDWSEHNPPEVPDDQGTCKFPTLQEAEAAAHAQAQQDMADKVAAAEAAAEAAGADLGTEMGNVLPGVTGLLKAAMGKAADEAEAQVAMAHMWGVDPGSLVRLPADQRMKLAKRMNNERFRRMADLFGPLQQLLAVEQKRKVNNVPEEPYDLSLGDDLERVLTTEFAGLMHPVLKLDFYRRYIEKELQQYEMKGTDKVARGGIVCCIDNSGSMAGDNELWAKAIALCLLHMARTQKRKFYGIHFGSTHELMEFDFSVDYSVEKVLDFAEYFFGGGTAFVRPLDLALSRLRTEFDTTGATTADIVFITDGACGVPGPWKDNWLAEMDRIGATMWGLLIGGRRGDQPLRDLCSGKVATVADILNPDKELAKVFAGL